MNHGLDSVDARVAGMTVAQAHAIEDDLHAYTARYPTLFPAEPMGPVPERLSQAVAFGAPGHTAVELRPAARTSLWVFGVDWLIDHQAQRAEDIIDIRNRCVVVADTGSPIDGDDLSTFLADVRAQVATSPAFAQHEGVWREELLAMLRAMIVEWSWKQQLRPQSTAQAPELGVQPPIPRDLDGYLSIADNIGSAWVNVAHWIYLADPVVLDHLLPLREASKTVQAALRLLNDLATADQEKVRGDINALALGFSEEAVRTRAGELADEANHLLRRLRGECPQGAHYLAEQLQYSQAFYGAGLDYKAPPNEPS
ncbi:terpene synthase family protein [Spirillospora sp. CA-108201]